MNERVLIDKMTAENSPLLPKIVEGIAKVAMGSGWGSVVIEIRDKQVVSVQSKEYNKIEYKFFVD